MSVEPPSPQTVNQKMSSDDSASNLPSETRGTWNSVVGSTMEAFGDATGLSSLSQAGKQQRLKGEAEIGSTDVKAQGNVTGGGDKLVGVKDSAMKVVLGDGRSELQGEKAKLPMEFDSDY